MVAGEEKLPGGAIKKLRLCSYFSIKKSNSPEKNSNKKKCFIRSWSFKSSRIKQCKAINSNCLNCIRAGHFAKACSQKKTIIVLRIKLLMVQRVMKVMVKMKHTNFSSYPIISKCVYSSFMRVPKIRSVEWHKQSWGVFWINRHHQQQ